MLWHLDWFIKSITMINPTRFLLLLLLSLLPTSCLYTFKNSYSLSGYSATSFALSPREVDAVSAKLNIAIGLMSGSVIFSHTNDWRTMYQAYPFTSAAILKMDWNEAGVFLQTIDQIKIIDPINYNTKIYLSFSESIISSCTAYYPSSSKIMIAVSFANRIQIFEGSQSILNRTTTSAVQAITFDISGNYFYYFNNYMRNVLDLSTKTYNATYWGVDQISIVASPKPAYEDITVSIQSGGYSIKVWDDFSNLGTYSAVNPQSLVMFTETGQFLLSYEPSTSTITVWKTNYNSFTSWSISQTFTENGGGSGLLLDASNGSIVTLSYGLFNVYTNENNSPVGLILGIVFGIIGLIVIVGVIAFCCKKKKAKSNQDQYQKINNQGFNPQPNQWNNGGQGFNGAQPYNGGYNNGGGNNGQGWPNNNNQGWGNQGWSNNNASTNNQGWSNNNQGWGNNKQESFNPYG